MALTVFKVDNGLLRPTVTQVPRTTAVAGAALQALGIPATVSVADGTATVALDKATHLNFTVGFKFLGTLCGVLGRTYGEMVRQLIATS